MIDNTIDVFLSSTCYDLVDLRAELAETLSARGLLVRRSEDPSSAFFVEPTEDSIASCLANVKAAKSVVAIIDRRYGPPLPEGTPYAGKSATHVEIDHARSLGKPVFYFIRNAALVEYQRLRRDLDFETRWVEPKDARRWREFVHELFDLPQHAEHSNWYDPFDNSVDLKQLVLNRLVQAFPEYAGTQAMNPSRMVRMTYIHAQADPSTAIGRFRNVGRGPALQVSHGVCRGRHQFPGGQDSLVASVGGLLEGESAVRDNQPNHGYTIGESQEAGVKLFCQYRNRFGDQYRVEVPLHRPDAMGWRPCEPELLYVWFPKSIPPSGDWVLQDGWGMR